MKYFTSRDLRESLTLLLPQRLDDNEGGWQEEWTAGPRLWAFINPISGETKNGPSYRIVIRSRIQLPIKIIFLWHLKDISKRLCVDGMPILIQQHRFLLMKAREEQNA